MSTLFDFDEETITTNITIYAKWEIQKHTVTFDTDEGSLITSVEVAHGGKVSQPNTPTKSGYIFKGWYKGKNLMTLFDFDKETVTTNETIYAKWEKLVLNASMAWISMREGLVQFDNSTQGASIIGVIVSKQSVPPVYASVKDLPGFYTRKTKIDGTPRTIYLSMTDEMTTAKFNANITVSVDGGATGFVSAIADAPELLHPNTMYYAHFYYITGTMGTAIEKLTFTTEDFPTTYPTARGTYSSVYNQIAMSSTSLNIEYKASESYLVPARFYYSLTRRGGYAWRFSSNPFFQMDESSTRNRPFGNTFTKKVLIYDIYNIIASGPSTSVSLWDTMLKITDLNYPITIDYIFGSRQFLFYDNKKSVLITE